MLKCPHYTKQSIESKQSIKIPMTFFTEIEEIILKFVWDHKRPWIVRGILKKNNKAGGIMCPISYYSCHILWQSNQSEMWGGKQTCGLMEPSREPKSKHTYTWSINLWWRSLEYTTKTISSINGVGKLENHMQRMKLDHFLTQYTKINFKWIKHFNVRHETIKLLKET